jgi:AraC-like DNA-binding protein
MRGQNERLAILMRGKKASPSVIVNRYTTSAFWTSDKDRMLRKLETAGVRLETIAAKLGVTPRSIKRRSRHLRGLPPFNWQGEERRAQTAKLREKKDRRLNGVFRAMRTAMARGTPRDVAIVRALARSAGPQDLADELGVSRQLIYRVIWQGATEQELRAKAKRRNERERRAKKAITAAIRSAIARGSPRDAAIARARRAGATYSDIGKQFGLTRQRVHQILFMQD